METSVKIEDVIVLGGTHGDEMSGVCLVRKWLNGPPLTAETCEVNPYLCNVEAIKLCRRYKDCDLNRQFTEENLKSALADGELSYEVKRAREMNEKFADTSGTRFVVDLHNTTSNSQLCLIVDDLDNFTLHMCRYIQQAFPKDVCRILMLGGGVINGDTLCMVKRGITIEVGPQPQGVLRADIIDLQEKAVKLSLEFIDKCNKGVCFDSCQIDGYTRSKKVDFPRDSHGDIAGMIHQNLQDQDWKPLTRSSKVLRMFNGDDVTLRDVTDDVGVEESVYPMFVNEAAYYEKGIAFYLANKTCVTLPTLKLNN
uniref:Aspartoacylase n=1 Tax=Ciona intestinalis TaxID=7719 RepID=F7BBL3_CIOIN